MDVEGFALLLAPGGRRLLEAAMASYGETDALTLSRRLRDLDDGYPADLVATALTQVSLRRSATTKFGADADRMYFTHAGLEQATHPAVAAHRAGRARAVIDGSVLDLGCGIGSDLAAFARAGFEVHGVDSDPLTAAVAAANLAALGLGLGYDGSVTRGQAQDVDRSPYDVVFADPARRKGATRVFDPRAFSPDWDFVLALLSREPSRLDRPALAVVKLAPGLAHALIPAHVEAEWVSLDGELKEVALWSPPPAPSLSPSGASREPGPGPATARRRATVLSSRSAPASCTDLEAPDEAPGVADIGRYLYEPDPAVIRAHLVSSVAAEVEGWLLDPHIAYVSSDREVRTPYARGFRVVDVLPFKEKALRAALRSRNIGTLTIKKRGVAVTPEELRRRLALRGSEAATVVLTRTPRSAAALLVEPLE